MPDDDNTPENRENGGEPADTDEAPAGDTGETGGDEVAKLRREAANYRTKLREAESRIEELDGQVYANRRLEAERLAGEELASGSDLFRDGATIEDLLGDDGLVDPDKVREATASVLEAHPHYAKPKGPAGSADGGLGEAPPAPSNPFATALKGHRG